ncbi:hypothetical protein JCM16303_000420 [Sporobolomyces ruberrimus]
MSLHQYARDPREETDPSSINIFSLSQRSSTALAPPGIVLPVPSMSNYRPYIPSLPSSILPASNYYHVQPVPAQPILAPPPGLAYPERTYPPHYPPSHQTTAIAPSRTPSQTASIGSFTSNSIPTPPPPGLSYPPPTPPVPQHPPGSHSTFLTIAMSRKSAQLKQQKTPSARLAPLSSPPLESPPDPNEKVLLSRFAPTFIPRWLLDVNTSMPSLVFPLSVSSSSEPTSTYNEIISDLYPPALLSSLVQAEELATDRIKRQLAQRPKLSLALEEPLINLDLHTLSPTTYAAHWIPLQALEYSARQFELFHSTLYNVVLSPYSSPTSPPSSTSTTHLFSLPTPFIRESWPPVQMGDTCYLRPLVEEIQGWKGVEVEAKVFAIERVKGIVVLKVEGEEASNWLKEETNEAGDDREDGEDELDEGEDGEGKKREEGIRVNVIWKIQDRLFESWKKSTEVIDQYLYRSVTEWPTSATLVPSTSDMKPIVSTNGKVEKTPRKRFPIESWLFPTKEDLAEPEEVTARSNIPSLVGRRWVDTNLNQEQKNAVQSILWAQHRAPLLISGPPGTGKTKTLVEAVFQILKEHPNAHVLVCGSSESSCDTLALRLRSLTPANLLRLNHPTRPLNEVRGELLPFCHVAGENFGIPTNLLSKRVICTTVLDCSVLLASRLTNSNLSSLKSHLSSRLDPDPSPSLEAPHFEFLLVDEAAQATESDLAPALAVVQTDPNISNTAHVTICGDSNQLSPHIVSATARDHDLDISLLERLLRLPLYADHPFSRRNRRKNPDLEWDVRRTPFVDLTKNYRSVEEILWLPSTLFYHESLVPCASKAIQETPLRNWRSNSSFPILFKNTSGEDFEVEEGSSFFNPSEINLVVSLVQDLVKNGKERGYGVVKAKEISVISPFREQVWRIRLALRKLYLGDVDVGNVEALQGAENRVVIVSPVRSINTRWIDHDRQTNRGLIFEPKRFNVAITRAKELLIVVGNAQTLTIDPYWRAFYHLCLRNDCYEGPAVKLEREQAGDLSSAAQAVSRMEMDYRARAQKTRDEVDEAREIDISVGRMVTLLDEGED